METSQPIIGYGPAQLTTIPFLLTYCRVPTPPSSQSPPSRSRHPHAASRLAARRRPASTLAGDHPPTSPATRSPRDGDEKPRNRPPGSSNKSRDGPEPPCPSPATSLRPRQRRGAPHPASSNKSRDGDEELRRSGCYATPTTPCDGESLTATLLCSCPLLM